MFYSRVIPPLQRLILEFGYSCKIQNVACFYFQVTGFTWIHTTAVSESSETHTSWLWGQKTETCAKGLLYVWWPCSQTLFAISNSMGLGKNTFGIDNFFFEIEFYILPLSATFFFFYQINFITCYRSVSWDFCIYCFVGNIRSMWKAPTVS